MRTKRVFLSAFGLAVAVVFAAVATRPAAAQLRGTYFETGSYTCLVSPSGFTNLAPNDPASAFVESSSLQGTLVFNANGTGTGENFKGVNVWGAASPHTDAFEYSFSFTYTQGAGGALTIQTGTNSGTILNGPPAGNTFTVQNSGGLSGRIALNLTATVTTTNASVETLVVTTPAAAVFNYPRVCQGEFVLTPVI